MRAVAVAALLAGCAPTPARVLATYEANLRAGRIEAAYALTSARYRATHDLPTFAAAAVRRPLVGGPPSRTGGARYVLRVDEMTLAGPTPGTLALTTDPLDIDHHDTPERTLRAFVRAVHEERREAVVALTSLLLRARLRLSTSPIVPFPASLAESSRIIEARLAVHDGIALPIIEQDVNGGSARLLLGDGRFVGLVENPGGWLVSELP
ncbi:MAG: hypothetical protein ABI321_06440 [Polyangia bacterium]